jgi:two-component system chemotaxis response regulator CheY
VLAAQDGLEALETLAREVVDLVVTDLNMPRLDGYGLVRAVREEPTTAAMPVIILSSLGKDEEIQEGLAAGANAYLVKPFDPKRIQYEVAKYLA